MPNEHQASYATLPFNVVGHLETQLDVKKKLLASQLQEHGRLERAAAETGKQIEEIEIAIAKLKS